VGLALGLFLAAAVAWEQYALLAVPVVLAVVWFAFVRLDWLVLAVVAMTPLSVTLQDRGFNVGLSLPTEPLLFGITLLLFFRLIMTGRINREVAKHPVSLAIYFYLGWMLLTSITSSMPLVSIKHWVARVWFVVPYFFLLVHVFQRKSYRELFFWLYLIPLAVAVAYTLSVHAQYDFSKQTSTWVMFPFFKEHTVYGAALALYIPAALYCLAQTVSAQPHGYGLPVLAPGCGIGLFLHAGGVVEFGGRFGNFPHPPLADQLVRGAVFGFDRVGRVVHNQRPSAAECRAQQSRFVGSTGRTRGFHEQHFHRRLQSGAPQQMEFRAAHVSGATLDRLGPGNLPISVRSVSALV